jgi:long-chain acyl-CoA synthetase
VDLRLLDDDGNDAADGKPGELLVGADSVMMGYWQNPEATDSAFLDGYYRTGDVARRDDEGFYYLVDRKREMIISGGLNVYPAEVERVIATHPGVREVAVIGVPDERWGEAVLALIIPHDGNVTEDDVVEHCRQNLAGYKKPQRVEFRQDLAKGSTGKLLKRELRAPYWDGHARAV